MKQTLRFISLLVAAALTSTLFVNCASPEHGRRAGEYLDDQSINARVKASLLQDETVAGFDVSTTTFDGVVQLSGFVDTPQQRERAGQVAQQVEGVQEVVNNITINPRAVEYGAPQDEDPRVVPEEAPDPQVQPQPQR